MQFAQRLLATRGGTIALSALAAVLAAVVFIVYLPAGGKIQDVVGSDAEGGELAIDEAAVALGARRRSDGIRHGS